MIRVHLTGPLSVLRDGEPVALLARKAEALLAVLARRPGVAFGREWLAALFWPDVPESQARTSLRQAVSHLRKGLGEDVVQGSAEKLHLDPSHVWVDLADVERLLAGPAVERGEVAEIARGELLVGFPPVEEPFERWLTEDRAHTSELLGRKMEECVAALSAVGRVDEAIRVGAWLAELAPTREAVHRALMALHAQQGDRAAAARQYQRCIQALRGHLGIAPSQETETLGAALRGSAGPVDVPSPTSARTADGRVRLAVVPFEPHPAEGTARLLASGLTDEVRVALARFRQLSIVVPEALARSASSGARLELRGSVLVSGDRTRVTATLVDSSVGLQLWAERWEQPAGDVFTVLDRLTARVVAELSLGIDQARLERARRVPPDRLEVYECWLRGMESLRNGTPESDEAARALFEQAARLSPGFARAYSGLSLAHFNDWSCQAWDRWEMREKLAFENAERAVELDDNDHVPHYILGRICLYRRDFARAARHLGAALDRNPNDPDAMIHLAGGFSLLGETGRATELCEQALAAHPRRPPWYDAVAASVATLDRRPADALALLELVPDVFVDTPAFRAIAAHHAGRPDVARASGAAFVDEVRRKIRRDANPAPGDAVEWFLKVNPVVRPEDEAYLLSGLAGAGLQRTM